MDETKETIQDSHQAEPGKAPDSEKGSTPEGEPEVYTKAQVEEAVQKARILAGRDAKALEVREQALAKREAEHEQWQKERDEELKASNPELYDISILKRGLSKERAELEADKATHAERLKAADDAERDVTIWRIAEEHKVDAEKLKAKSSKLNLQDKEQIAELAQTMAESKVGDTPLKPVSGVTIGGVNLSDLTPDEKIRKGLSRQK